MKQPLVNVTLPVFNEERVLAPTVCKVVKYLEKNCPHPYEVVIANNGSTDKTQAVAEELSLRFPAVRIVSLPEAGRGRTLKKVWLESKADILSYMDVDLSTDLTAWRPLVDTLIQGDNDLACGSRRLKASVVQRGFKREFTSWVYHVLIRALFRVRFSDAQCGFKAVTKKAAEELLPLVEDDGWFMDAELLILAERLGYRISDQPVHWVEDTDSRVRLGRDTLATMRSALRLRRRLARDQRFDSVFVRQNALKRPVG